jgi:serine/threonine-protein phosphatase 2A regulatory subunit B'
MSGSRKKPLRTPSGLVPEPSAYGRSIRSDAPLRSLSKKNLLRSPSFSDLAQRGGTIEVLPSLRDTAPAEQPALLRRQLAQALVAFDFTDAAASLPQKELKRQLLTDILEHITEQPAAVTPDLYADFAKMFSANLFRALPPPSGPPGMDFDPEDDEPMLEEAWPHVQLVYDILLQFTVCDLDYRAAREFIDSKFVLRLLALFDSEDPRERDHLKSALHRLYSKFLKHRVLIRRAITDIFHTVIYETGVHNGIAELLEILGSIINGFVVPIKPEHQQFLLRTLVPLHTVKALNLFHSQLAYCVIQFVDKDPELADPVVRGLARRFPRANSPKALLILGEIETIVEISPHPVFVRYREILARLLARLLSSPHFQVAERTLALLNNECVRCGYVFFFFFLCFFFFFFFFFFSFLLPFWVLHSPSQVRSLAARVRG